MRTLQCHSRGDVRFSPFGARVRMFGRVNTIENHYQSSKVFEDGRVPADWRQAREIKRSGLRHVGWKIGPRHLKTRQDPRNPSAFALEDFGVQLYCLLWCKYIRSHPKTLARRREARVGSQKFVVGQQCEGRIDRVRQNGLFVGPADPSRPMFA